MEGLRLTAQAKGLPPKPQAEPNPLQRFENGVQLLVALVTIFVMGTMFVIFWAQIVRLAHLMGLPL
jgi:hypothetical protein